MTQYLLDTNICIHLLHGKFNVKERIMSIGINNCHVSDITLAELYFGAYNSNCPEETLTGVRLIERMFHIVRLDNNALQRFGSEKANLCKKGQIIDDFDILIGATAIENQMTIVTENIKHLQRLPANIENWIERKNNKA